MKYYTICFPGKYGQNVVETWSEDQIIESYWEYWAGKMRAKFKDADISLYSTEAVKQCIDDWCVGNWAEETDKWGNKLDHGV